MSDPRPIPIEDLHAFIDGELDAQRQAEIEEHLAADPELAAQVATFSADKAMISRIYGPLIEQPLPIHWLARIRRGRGQRPRWVAVGGALAASLALLIVGSSFLLPPLSPLRQAGVVDDALAARNEALAPTEVLGAHQLGGAEAALTRNLSLRAHAPDLSRMGYRLSAVRTYATQEGRAVELIYRAHGKDDFALFVRRSSGAPRFDVFEKNGLRVCLWQDEEVATVMTGHMSAAEMQRLASLAYEGLEG